MRSSPSCDDQRQRAGAVSDERVRDCSVEELELVGSGGTCSVYSLGNAVLKAFNPTIPEANVRAEYARASVAWAAGIPTACPHELVRVVGAMPSWGIVFERVEGNTVAEDVETGLLNPVDTARQLGSMLRTLHETNVDPHVFPDQRLVFVGYSRMLPAVYGNLIDEAEAEGVARLFEALPECHGFLHGDFHMNNVMHEHDANGDRLVLIDLAGAGSGHPLLDWAGTFQACRLIPDYFDPTACRRFIGLSADKARSMLRPMMESYYQTPDEDALLPKYRLMEALAYAKYACMAVREPNPWMDLQLVASQLREHVLSQIEELTELLATETFCLS